MKKNLGFTLVEVVVSAGLTALLILGLSSAILSTKSVQTSIENSLDFGRTQASLQRILNNRETCRKSLEGSPLVGPINIKDPTDPTVPPRNLLAAGEDYRSFRVTNIVFSDVQNVSATERIANLKIDYQVKADIPKQMGILMMLKVDAGGKISECWTASSEQENCSAMGGTYDGAVSPPCKIAKLYSGSCVPPQLLQGFDAAGNPVCATPGGSPPPPPPPPPPPSGTWVNTGTNIMGNATCPASVIGTPCSPLGSTCLIPYARLFSTQLICR